jgi:hypothetical protein
MRKLRTPLIGFSFALACGALSGAAAGELPVDKHARAMDLSGAEPRHALYWSGAPIEMYSFADVHRLTVSGVLVAPPAPLDGTAVRVLASAAAPRLEAARFMIGPAAEPEGWLLALTGLMVAGWVAARRLGYPQA